MTRNKGYFSTAIEKIRSPSNIYSFLFRLYYCTLGYPRLRLKVKFLRKLHVPRAELIAATRTGTRMKLSQFAVIVLSLLIGSYHLSFPLYTYSILLEYYNSKSTDAQIQYLNSSYNVEKRLGCLITNCSFYEDLISLPIYYLCNQSWVLVEHYTVRLHTFGIILQTIQSFIYLALGVLFPVHFYLAPNAHPFATFTLLTMTSQRMMCEFIKEHLKCVNLSMINYHQHLKLYTGGVAVREVDDNSEFCSFCHCHHGSLDLMDKEDDIRHEKEIASLDLRAEQMQSESFSKPFVRLNQSEKNYVADCLTVYRTNWWKGKAIENFVLIYFIMLAETILFGVIMFIHANRRLIDNIDGIHRLGKRINLYNCSVWYEYEILSDRFVHLDEIDSNHTLYSILEISTFLVFFLSANSYLLAHLIVSTQEIKFQFAEQMDRIKIAISVSEMLGIFEDKSLRTNGIYVESHSYLPSKLIRSMHRRSFDGLIISTSKYTNPFSSHVMIESRKVHEENLQTIIIEQLSSQPDLDTHLNSLIMIYIGLKSMAQLIKDAGENTSLILFNCSLQFLIIEFLVTYLKIRFNYSHIVLTMIGLAALIIYTCEILIPASVHAMSRRLLSLMWRLIAAQAHYGDIRIRHLRLLLIKLTSSLHEINGLSLKAYGKPLTSEFLIRIIVWSSSFFILTLSV